MKGYCTNEEENICLPQYRIIFPFLWKDLIDGRAKRYSRGQPLPMLLNSYKAHRMIITVLIYLDGPELLFR